MPPFLNQIPCDTFISDILQVQIGLHNPQFLKAVKFRSLVVAETILFIRSAFAPYISQSSHWIRAMRHI